MATRTVLTVLVVLTAISIAYARLRFSFTDAQIVSRTELIVVGAVKKGTLRQVGTRGDGHLPENHLELEVSEFIKGTNITRNIPVCITWGLTPVTGGHYQDHGHEVHWKAWIGDTNYPKEIIEIFDTGNSISGLPPFTGDIRSNHIWLLRPTYLTTNWTKDATSSYFEKVKYSYYCRSNLLSIYDPEDVQLMRRKADLMKHLK